MQMSASKHFFIILFALFDQVLLSKPMTYSDDNVNFDSSVNIFGVLIFIGRQPVCMSHAK